VVEVEVLDRKGVRHTRTPAEYEIGYRQVKGPENEWFIGARLEFERKPGANTNAIKELLDKRRDTQPIGEWSCGSVFTNPPGDHAARLIEAAGLKLTGLGVAAGAQAGDDPENPAAGGEQGKGGNTAAGDRKATMRLVTQLQLARSMAEE